jgi:peptidoglycan hydrolase-like protein with peptidoglycan-binding domain
MWLQQSLNYLMNAGLEVDGEYGPLTKAAVMEFQKANQPQSGPVDGWAGPKTCLVIREALSNKKD